MSTAVRHGEKTTHQRLGEKIAYRPRLLGAERARTAARLRRDYEKGRSVRRVAEDADLSYGTAYTLLQEAGTVMRDRQGRLPGTAPAEAAL